MCPRARCGCSEVMGVPFRESVCGGGLIGGDIGHGLAVQRLLVCGAGVLPGGGPVPEQVQSAPETVVWAGMTVAVVRAVPLGGRRLRASGLALVDEVVAFLGDGGGLAAGLFESAAGVAATAGGAARTG